MGALDKVQRFVAHFTSHGGIMGVWRQFVRTAELKPGTLIGIDKYGNKYYEDKRCFFGRHRWVTYTNEMNGKDTYEADGSMVPSEWHGWLHSITDNPPTTHPPDPKKFLAKVHQLNLSGSNKCYVPYPTTRKKIQEWVPPKVSEN
ncbi:hypothetical protein DNTS_018484 [Danionella cerebrum]|uniref:NADH dehydrogenase [ubiquinone] 1 alpha subcomplex subunit 12 n=1 Tax=Danionella cerebrum TaxID=2873325 RepID=A0A553MYY6_9TELE|nr:hypothetical protein DNTS_018484 [Danionella translucida]